MWILNTGTILEKFKKEANYGDLSLVSKEILIWLLTVEIMIMCCGFS